jgi:hypothetical protein
MIPNLTIQIYGLRKGKFIFSYLLTSVGLSALFLIILEANEVEFPAHLNISLIFSVLALILTVFIDEKKINYF